MTKAQFIEAIDDIRSGLYSLPGSPKCTKCMGYSGAVKVLSRHAYICQPRYFSLYLRDFRSCVDELLEHSRDMHSGNRRFY